MKCRYARICSGCTLIHHSEDQQVHKKKDHFSELATHFLGQALPLSQLNIRVGPRQGYRNHVDLTLHRVNGRRHIGLYDQQRQHIVDLEDCPLMSPALLEWYRDIRHIIPSIQFGHLRLRLAPDGRRGIWLDLPRTTLNYFLTERRFLQRLTKRGSVEIGQQLRRIHPETLIPMPEPVLEAWSQAFVSDRTEGLPLYGAIASFSQPGDDFNRTLSSMVQDRVIGHTRSVAWLELGAGSGNFTLPLASHNLPVTAFEMNPIAVRGLHKSLDAANLAEAVEVVSGNFHQFGRTGKAYFHANHGLLVDPPRSGLGGFIPFLAGLPEARRPRDIIYVSCFAASLLGDALQLQEQGYHLIHAEGLDQFPHSPHCEWVVHFQRNF